MPGELGGFDSTSHLSHARLPSSLQLCHPSSLLTSPSSVCHILTPALALPQHSLLSLSCLLPCLSPHFLYCHCLPPVIRCRWDLRSCRKQKWSEMCLHAGTFQHISWCMCALRRIRKINRGQLLPARNQYLYGHAWTENAGIINPLKNKKRNSCSNI